MNYRVMWEEVIQADSFRDAAEKADKMQRQLGGPSKKFEITDDKGQFEPVAMNAPPVDEEQAALEAAYRDAAGDKYAASSNGDIDIEQNAAVSMSEDGAFVQAWVWVSDADAGVEEVE